MSESSWEFAIDVGGTFTDCLAYHRDGRQLRHKLLSSGITKGALGANSTADQIVDLSRQGDPQDFWVGYQFSLLDTLGSTVAQSTVSAFDAPTGTLQLDSPLSAPLSDGAAYELSCHLEAPVIGIRYLLGLPLAVTVPPVNLRLGTTRGTNALLTRSGPRTALVTTRGFGDLLQIGYQNRPRLFDLTIRKPEPLIQCSIEVAQRVAADGEVLVPLELEETSRQLEQARQEGIEALAICLLHGDLYPEHEQQIAERAGELGFKEISCSSDVAPLVKIVPRAETTVVDAYLNPVLRGYLERLQHALPDSEIRLMTSAGGLVAANNFRGHESVLSGPAGGVVGYARVARSAGFERAIGFDMGGTSTDVSRFDGDYEFEFESRKAGAWLVAPTLAIETVAAGGGSICHFDGAKLTVGPDSAGADPGPACYGRGGPLTVTDVNYYLGRIVTKYFPFALNLEPVENHLQQLSQSVADATGQELSESELAEGLLRIANANMARAVRGVSVAKGADPRDYVMVAFGGAGAQHACAVARELGIRKILNHPDAGILSAYGIGRADVVRHAAKGLPMELDQTDPGELRSHLEHLAADPLRQVLDSGCSREQIDIRQSLDLRYVGTDTPINVPLESIPNLKADFENRHQMLFGYRQSDRVIEVVAIRVQVTGTTKQSEEHSVSCPAFDSKANSHEHVWFAGEATNTPIFERSGLTPGSSLTGPAIVADQHSTIVVEPGWEAEMLSAGEILLSDRQDAVSTPKANVAADPVMLEVFNHLLSGIAEQMGHVLRRTASSVNVKERLDYSCAVFTGQGELVANAPHVPVHLGAMGATVRAMIAERAEMHPGDVYVTNDPYCGGSHLPDITVITPVHDPTNRALLFFTACRAHHAEIGGIRPGSMPPNSQFLAEEGVLISNFALLQRGVSAEHELRALLSAGPFPSRRVEENLADLRAQVAANRQGASDLLALIDRYSLPTVQTQVRGIQDAAEAKVRGALSKLGRKHGRFTDHLETADGQSVPVCVQLTLRSSPEAPAMTIDFTGTSPVVAGNLNANRAIVTAAVLYVLRLLVNEDIPLNEGALRAVEIVLPVGILNPSAGATPATTPAVAAGNVETSQRVVDVLLGALGIAGASQGTMNNVLFGNQSFGYYETICGGSGATAVGPGADAVQVHMTNTRSTDPEILERRLPVRLHEFSIRRGSGGKGDFRGGDGVERRLEFLEPLQLSLITQRRGPHPPYGMAGGEAGELGANGLIRAGRTLQPLPGICEVEVTAGDILVLKTPGGGGFGRQPGSRGL